MDLGAGKMFLSFSHHLRMLAFLYGNKTFLTTSEEKLERQPIIGLGRCGRKHKKTLGLKCQVYTL